ncbi:MAG: Gfo/Idh/MocA family oxidoreductase [Sediminicola sp.]|tara:strand:- start:19137 stop:20150 length:1014 start_codon:yes stop_codon:yes gene_type:complete
MKNPIKTGVLSYGMSGKLFHFPFLREHQGFQLSAVVERSNKEAQKEYPSIISYGSVEELIEDPTIELVVVNTPTPTHFDFALKALRAKKHVLLEKAFTITSQQAEQLFKEAAQVQRSVLAYQNRRYDSDFLSVKKVLDSGKLESLVEVHMRFDRYRYAIGPKVAKESPVPGSGLLYDLGPHLLDQVISLFGNPLEFRKHLGHFRPNTKVDDYAHIHLLYPKGLQVHLTMSMLVVAIQPAFVLNGTKGSFIKQRADVQEEQLLKGIRPEDAGYGEEESDKAGILVTMANDGSRIEERIPAPKASYIQLFEDVYGAIREGKEYPVTQAQLLQQLQILES